MQDDYNHLAITVLDYLNKLGIVKDAQVNNVVRTSLAQHLEPLFDIKAKPGK